MSLLKILLLRDLSCEKWKGKCKLKLKTAAMCASVLAILPIANNITVNAYENSYQNFEYNLTEDNKIVLFNYVGNETDIVIPKEIDGKIVSSIETGTFYGCTSIRSIEFESNQIELKPNSVGYVTENATVPITIIGNYTSTAHTYANNNNFEFESNDLIDINTVFTVMPNTTYTYDGTAKCPEPILVNGTQLIKNTDYTISYSSNVNVGQAKITITGIGQYTGSITKNFTIKKINISKYPVTLSSMSVNYTGKAVKPTATVGNLVRGKDYTISYNNNIETGTAWITINGIGNYSGSITKTFKITLPAVTNIDTSAATDSSITLKWTKTKGATGYAVYLVTNGKLVKKADVNTNSAVINSLSAGTNYSFVVKAYRNSNNGKTYSSSYKKIKLSTAPTKVKFTISTTKKGKATISWKKVKGATKYAVFYKQNKSDKWTKMTTTTGNSYTLTGISGSKGGYVTVKAYKKFGSKTVGSKYTRTTIYKYSKAAAKLDKCGWDLKKAFNASLLTYYNVGLPVTGDVAMEWYANYGFDHNYGHCYCMTAMFTEMAKTMGYNCTQVYGTVGISPHSWAEIVLNGTTYICDPSFQNGTGKNGYCIIYGTPGTWKYNKIGKVKTEL